MPQSQETVPLGVSVSREDLPAFSPERCFQYARWLCSEEGKRWKEGMKVKERQCTELARGGYYE